LLDRLARGGLDRIGDADDAGELAIDTQEHHGLCLLAQVAQPMRRLNERLWANARSSSGLPG